jgi:FtsZ-interacting cell division protein YlmF
MTTLDEWEEATVYEEVSVEDIDKAMKDYAEKRADYEAKKELSNLADAETKEAKTRLINILKASGKTKWEVEGIGKASVTTKMTVTTPKEFDEKKKMLDYINSLGQEVFISLVNVNHMTLNSFYNQQKELDPSFEIPGVGMPVAEDNIRFTRTK